MCLGILYVDSNAVLVESDVTVCVVSDIQTDTALSVLVTTNDDPFHLVEGEGRLDAVDIVPCIQLNARNRQPFIVTRRFYIRSRVQVRIKALAVELDRAAVLREQRCRHRQLDDGKQK